VHPTQRVEIFRNTRICTVVRRLVHWPSVNIHGTFYGDHLRGTPPLGGLNARGVAKYSDFEAFGRHILETVQGWR